VIKKTHDLHVKSSLGVEIKINMSKWYIAEKVFVRIYSIYNKKKKKKLKQQCRS
jgi:hypothetical protein